MGTIHQVPKKLAVGMKVVVCWHRDWIPFTWYERNKGYKHGKWLKGTLLSIGKGEWTDIESFVVRIGNDEHCLFQGDVIVVRSVATKDNKSERYQETLQRASKVYRDKTQKLAALKAESKKAALSN